MADRVEHQLLGLLLEALDDAEQKQLEEQLAADPELRRRLSRLQEALCPLEATRVRFEPPPGLAERTGRLVFRVACERAEASQRRELEAAPSAAVLDPVLQATRPAEPLAGAVAPPSSSGGWSWRDLAVAAAIFAAAALLVIPAIENSRFNARLVACQDNLRLLGQALSQYSQRHQDYFPPIPQQGRLATAGVFAPVLASAGYLGSSRLVVCPASPLADDRQFRIPSLEEIAAVEDPARLERLRGLMGGSYGYCLGYVEDGRYRSPRNLRRAQFALMSDAPSDQLPGYQSVNHGGRGQNVLLEDFHVQFFTTPQPNGLRDHFFLNDSGQVAAGRHRDDAVIGRSGASPLRYVGTSGR